MIVNGKEESLVKLGKRTLLELVEHYGFKQGQVAVERNGEIPAPEKWGSIQLSDTDRIELIRFVGGG